MKIRIYSIYKAKNVFGVIFQITCFNLWKNIIVCLVCMFFFLKLTSGPPSWNWRRKFYVLSNQVDPMFFKIFTKVSLSDVTWNLKIGKKSFLNSMFKHLKMSNVTLTLLKKTLTKHIIFFLKPQFLMFKHWKLLFGITYRTVLNILSYVDHWWYID